MRSVSIMRLSECAIPSPRRSSTTTALYIRFEYFADDAFMYARWHSRLYAIWRRKLSSG